MTATRDRRSDPEIDADTAWDDRPIIGTSRGLPWWGAVLLTFGLTAIAAFVDMQSQDKLGRIYQGAYIVGCVAAVCWVRRRSLFGPMVQPPLVFALTAIGAIILLGNNSSGGLKALMLSVALPLTSNFPTMGITTAVTVAIGLFRLYRQRNPDPHMRPNRAQKDRGRGSALGLDDEPGQSTGGRALRERPSKDRAAPVPRTRGRAEPEDVGEESRPPRKPGRTSRPTREPGSDTSRESTREPRPNRRDQPPRGRTEPPPATDRAARGRGKGRQPDPAPRRREGSEGRAAREDRGSAPRREPGRSSQPPRPRRRPPEDDYR